jgi:hypothetical protein
MGDLTFPSWVDLGRASASPCFPYIWELICATIAARHREGCSASATTDDNSNPHDYEGTLIQHYEGTLIQRSFCKRSSRDEVANGRGVMIISRYRNLAWGDPAEARRGDVGCGRQKPAAIIGLTWRLPRNDRSTG